MRSYQLNKKNLKYLLNANQHKHINFNWTKNIKLKFHMINKRSSQIEKILHIM